MDVKPLLAVRGSSGLDGKRILIITLMCVLAVLAAGCSSLVPNSAASNTTPTSTQQQVISIRSGLPNGTVNNPYSVVLSVSGGRAPYSFAISGQLPTGLSLNAATGAISGRPTQAGNFAFTVSVRGQDPGTFGSRAYTIGVNPCLACVSVEISPLSPSMAPGAKQQFAAHVLNTSNTAVTWSATAGSITSSGLFTAPTTSGTRSAMVTAASVAEPSITATTTISLAIPETLKVATTTLPNAQVGASYDAQLSAGGGTLPYHWTISSGTLPSGLILGSSGALGGTTVHSGSYQLTVSVADSASHTAQQSLTLVVSSLKSCGPPTYHCARSDFKIVQMPQAAPNVGNLLGANKIVNDPDFGSSIVRITDWNTDQTLPNENRSFVSAASGSADENLWNLDSTLFVIQSMGSGSYPYTFNPSTLQAARMYVSSFPATGGMRMSDSGGWSRVNANILYSDMDTGIYKYDFTDRSTPPSPQLVVDFKNSRNCLPAGFSVTWKTRGGVSAGDTVFGMAYSDAGVQGSAVYAVAYKVGSGCSMLNTQTGKVTGEWGASGTIGIPDRWKIHNVKVSKDGNWLIVAPQSCLISDCEQGPFFWQIGTTNVTACASGKHCGGHWTEGYTHWVNNNDPGNQVSRPLPEVKDVLELTNQLPDGLQAPLDEHLSWNNADPSDSLPFLVTTWSPTRPFPSAFYNEIFGVASDGSGKIYRFAHSFISGQSPYFSTAYGIGSVSQDGRFFIFSSDWMGTLGSQNAGSSCRVALDCRGDVFVVQLN